MDQSVVDDNWGGRYLHQCWEERNNEPRVYPDPIPVPDIISIEYRGVVKWRSSGSLYVGVPWNIHDPSCRQSYIHDSFICSHLYSTMEIADQAGHLIECVTIAKRKPSVGPFYLFADSSQSLANFLIAFCMLESNITFDQACDIVAIVVDMRVDCLMGYYDEFKHFNKAVKSGGVTNSLREKLEEYRTKEKEREQRRVSHQKPIVFVITPDE